jgi:hypothetical protein
MCMEDSAGRRCAIYQFNWGTLTFPPCALPIANNRWSSPSVLTKLKHSGNCNTSILAHRFEIESGDVPPTSDGFPL